MRWWGFGVKLLLNPEKGGSTQAGGEALRTVRAGSGDAAQPTHVPDPSTPLAPSHIHGVMCRCWARLSG